MLLYSHLSQFSQIKFPVQGPLVMCPPAEDNYGVDACSILCLATPFPVLVISTCEGRIHHCVQLPGSLDSESSQLDVSSMKYPVSSSTCLYESIPEPILYVVETAELELCLSMPQFEGETSVEDDFMCPVRLKKDNSCFDRYHCAHAAGVHSVALPWLNAVEQYFLDESNEFNMPEEKECIVEHLLCTKPLLSCPTCPVLGVDVVSDPMLGPTLLILSSDYEFTALPIGLQYRLSSVQKRDDADTDAKLLSPFRHHSREPFSKQVEQILQKRVSNPLLKSGHGATLSQQDCFQLLSRATQVLREEYIQKQDHARQELDTRIDILREHKEHQLQDLKRLLDSRHMLREHARTIAERLETSKDNHENLLKRLQTVLRKIQSRVPVLSESERNMYKELTKIKDNIQLYTDSIDQVRIKQQYQDRQITKTSKAEAPVLQKRQLAQIYDVLKDEADDIEKLKWDISRLNIAFN
uniref:Nuclear pore complex protein Nup88 n=1 Tax=Arion vulgaris TaxID=1028688 RepID=A0A0B7A940_9EUPU